MHSVQLVLFLMLTGKVEYLSMAETRKHLSVKEKIDIMNEIEWSDLSTRKIATKIQIGKTHSDPAVTNK